MFRPAAGRRARLALEIGHRCRIFHGRRCRRWPAMLLAVIFVTSHRTSCSTPPVSKSRPETKPISSASLRCSDLPMSLIAALGGYVSCLSLSRSMLVRAAGAPAAVGGLTVAAISAAVLLADPSFLGYVPKYILGGLLFFLGANLALPMAGRSSRRLLLHRISVADRDRRSDHLFRLHRRRPDRCGDRLRDLRAERQPRECHQVQFRRLGIPLLARSWPRRIVALGPARPGNSRHGAAELSVLRLSQSALSARQNDCCRCSRIAVS